MPQVAEAVEAYMVEVTARVSEALGRELVGVYAGGSLALGDYLPGRSDLDVAAVSDASLSRPAKECLVELLRHEALPCPARGLEFVVYTRATAAAASAAARYELDLNTGSRMRFKASFDSGEADPHWYAIDRSILAAHGQALAGPPASKVFRALPPEVMMPVLADSLRWHSSSPDAKADDAVLNACRALHYARTGAWASKPAAGAWARGVVADVELVELALAARGGGGALPRARVDRFLAAAATGLQEPSPRAT